MLTPTTSERSRTKPLSPQEKQAHRAEVVARRRVRERAAETAVEEMCDLLADVDRCDMFDALKLEFALGPACVGKPRQMGMAFIAQLKEARQFELLPESRGKGVQPKGDAPGLDVLQACAHGTARHSKAHRPIRAAPHRRCCWATLSCALKRCA